MRCKPTESAEDTDVNYSQKGLSKVSNCACVYLLIDPFTIIPFYVGIGKPSRPRAHFKGVNNNLHRWNKICKLRQLGVRDEDMIWVTATELSADAARAEEVRLITLFGRRSIGTGPLTNATPGGDKNIHDDPIAHKRHAVAMARYWALPESMARIKIHAAKLNSDPEIKQRRVAAIKLAAKRPDVKERQKLAAIASWDTWGKRQRRSEAMRAGHARPGVSERHSAATKLAWATSTMRETFAATIASRRKPC
jgi:hypothetical protein